MWIAARMRGYVPQRQIFPLIAASIGISRMRRLSPAGGIGNEMTMFDPGHVFSARRHAISKRIQARPSYL
jgi:hypothetical protein